MNRNMTLMALASVVILALVGCSGGGSSKGGDDSKPFGDAAKGKEIFASTCVSCHGPDAKGMPGLGKNLVQPSEWMKKQSNEQLLELIKSGRLASDPVNTTKVDMPAKGGNLALMDEDLKNVVAYIRSIQKK